MTTTLIAIFVLLAIFIAISIFLVKEMLKKFGFMRKFVKSSHLLEDFHYYGLSKNGKVKPGMRIIVLKSKDEKKFSVLIGFKLKIFGKVGFDYYGYVESNNLGMVVISTYLGKSPVDFQFFKNNDVDVKVCISNNTNLIPQVTYPPHFWQRLGIFA